MLVPRARLVFGDGSKSLLAGVAIHVITRNEEFLEPQHPSHVGRHRRMGHETVDELIGLIKMFGAAQYIDQDRLVAGARFIEGPIDPGPKIRTAPAALDRPVPLLKIVIHPS